MRSVTDAKTELLGKIRDRTAVVGVVGLGYVGLPFAVEKGKVGFRVIGIEQNPSRVELDVVVICVPTPLTKNLTPDLSHVEP